VDGAEIGVFEEGDEVSLNGFLEGTDGGRLEAQVRFEILGNLTNQTLERQLSDQELRRLLVTTDLTESDGS
jgi:hypothetical protein